MSVQNIQRHPTTIEYKYLFTYQGEGTFQKDVVKGAAITIAIKTYRYGNVMPIGLEPMYNGHFLNEIFEVSINKFSQFTIEKNKFMERIFKDVFKFDVAECEIVGYSIEVLKEIKDTDKVSLYGAVVMPKMESIRVSEEELRNFISDNIDGFLLKENKKAKVENATLISLEVAK